MKATSVEHHLVLLDRPPVEHIGGNVLRRDVDALSTRFRPERWGNADCRRLLSHQRANLGKNVCGRGFSAGIPHQFALPVRRDVAVTGERGKRAFMAEVLAPGFDFFRAVAMRISKMGKHMTQAVRREWGEASIHECLLEDFADPRGARPELPAYAIRNKTVIGIQADKGFREEGIVIAEQERLSEINAAIQQQSARKCHSLEKRTCRSVCWPLSRPL